MVCLVFDGWDKVCLRCATDKTLSVNLSIIPQKLEMEWTLEIKWTVHRSKRQ